MVESGRVGKGKTTLSQPEVPRLQEHEQLDQRQNRICSFFRSKRIRLVKVCAGSVVRVHFVLFFPAISGCGVDTFDGE